MIFKVGDVYRNKETNTPCFIKDAKGEDYAVTWCFKSVRVKDWPRPLQEWEDTYEGVDGYIEYTLLCKHKELLRSVTENNISLVDYGKEDKFILSWIPQHCFLAAK